MKPYFKTKLFSLLLSIVFLGQSLFFFSPAQASAGEENLPYQDISLDASFHLFPQAINENPSDVLLGLASIGDRLSFHVGGTLYTYMTEVDFSLWDRGQAVFNGYMSGNPISYKINSDLFPGATLNIDLPNYIPFLTKASEYFDFPFQYIGLLTDVYSFEYGVGPVKKEVLSLFKGNKSRTYSPQQTFAEIDAFAQFLYKTDAFTTYVNGLLHQSGLDYLIDDFVYDLPDWIREVAPDGLVINVEPGYEIWASGDTVFLQKEEIDDQQLFSITLPPYDGYSLTIEYQLSKMKNGYSIIAFFSLTQDDKDAISLYVSGAYTADDKDARHRVSANISIWGSGVSKPVNLLIDLPYTITKENDNTFYDGSLSLLNPANNLPMGTLDFSYVTTPSAVFPSSRIPSSWPEHTVFTMNDLTFPALKTQVVKPILKKLLPFALTLPTSVVVPLLQWAQGHNVFNMFLSR